MVSIRIEYYYFTHANLRAYACLMTIPFHLTVRLFYSRLIAMSSGKKKLLINTDAGIDDAQAILMALNDPDVEVVAITTSHGNTFEHHVCRNVLRLLKMAGRLDVSFDLAFCYWY